MDCDNNAVDFTLFKAEFVKKEKNVKSSFEGFLIKIN